MQYINNTAGNQLTTEERVISLAYVSNMSPGKPLRIRGEVGINHRTAVQNAIGHSNAKIGLWKERQ